VSLSLIASKRGARETQARGYKLKGGNDRISSIPDITGSKNAFLSFRAITFQLMQEDLKNISIYVRITG
jgi:hypothetical protein